jgi:hypothetical protein
VRSAFTPHRCLPPLRHAEPQHSVSSSPRVPSSIRSSTTHSPGKSSCQEPWRHSNKADITPYMSSQHQHHKPREVSKTTISFDRPRYVAQSTPRMYHPQPVRGERHRLFDIASPDLDIADSTIVQVGRNSESSV